MKLKSVIAAFVICACSIGSIAQTSGTAGAAASRAKTTTNKPVNSSANRTVLISTDMDCTIRIDSGNPKSLSLDKVLTMKLGPGEHLIVATSADGKDVWKQVIKLDKPTQKVVTIALSSVKEAREQGARAQQELEDARNQERLEQEKTVRDAEERAQRQQQKEVAEAAKRESNQEKRKQIAELKSQISALQDQVRDAEQQASQTEAAIAQTNCAQAQYPLICIAGQGMTRQVAASYRSQASMSKDQIRDLQKQIDDIQSEIE